MIVQKAKKRSFNKNYLNSFKNIRSLKEAKRKETLHQTLIHLGHHPLMILTHHLVVHQTLIIQIKVVFPRKVVKMTERIKGSIKMIKKKAIIIVNNTKKIRKEEMKVGVRVVIKKEEKESSNN